MSTAMETYNPDYDPTGIEGGVDANKLPWVPVPEVPQMAIKPLRAGMESGMFSVIVRLRKGASIPGAVYLGGMDMMVLSGQLEYRQDNKQSLLEAGVWGYVSANSRIDSLTAREDAEFLANFYNAIVFLSDDGAIRSVFTSSDVRTLARQHNIALVPSTLAACTKERSSPFSDAGNSLAIASIDARELVVAMDKRRGTSEPIITHPHFIDTRKIAWAFADGMPQIGFKILRISEETQIVSLITRHNGTAPAHTHVGAADFLILNGRIGYRAGPPDGYGPGTWIFEPAGARHDATQRLTAEDLIYTANIYGAVVFDSGRGTVPTAILSWMQWKDLAEAAGVHLVPSTNPNDSALLAWAPLKVA